LIATGTPAGNVNVNSQDDGSGLSFLNGSGPPLFERYCYENTINPINYVYNAAVLSLLGRGEGVVLMKKIRLSTCFISTVEVSDDSTDAVAVREAKDAMSYCLPFVLDGEDFLDCVITGTNNITSEEL
jgi:hypothetical protein